MSRSVERFITRMKLTELRRQREKLRSAYQPLADRVEQSDSPGDRLRRLAERLREIRFAQASLHEDVKHLRLLADAIKAGGVGDEVAAIWLGQLEGQLAAGRLRSEFIYAFGALLEEWAHGQDE